MKELLEAGVHFGHQTKRWNPKMKQYIFGERNGIYIIDLQKKEVPRLERERKALEKNLSGIKNMPGLPDAIFIIDSKNEEIAVAEARRLGIPVIAIVDTNCDPDVIDYVIPGNDDALRAIRLFASKVSDSVIEGQQMAKEAAPPTEESEDGESVVAFERTRAKRVAGDEDSVETPNEAAIM